MSWCWRLSCLALVLAASPAAAERLHATYDISLLGLPIGAGAINVDLTPKTYRIEAQGKLNALASLIVNSRGASSGSGAVQGDRLSPAAFATTASSSRSTRTIRMSLKDHAVTAVDIDPPFDVKPDRIPLGPGDTRNIIDPVGGVLVPGPKAGAPIDTACNHTIPVFDGFTRFDLTLSAAGQKNVAAKGYSGPVAICKVRYVPIAGHRRDRPGTKFMEENKDIEAWLAPVGKSGWLAPFRVSVRTMIGLVEIEAEGFEISE